jgi:hypothetical protein
MTISPAPPVDARTGRLTTVPSASTTNFEVQRTSPLYPSGRWHRRAPRSGPIGPLDLDLLREREGDAVRGGAELSDLLRGARLLAAELVARYAKDGERGVGLGEPLQSGVLRRQATPGGDVDDQGGFTAVPGQFVGFSREGRDLEVEDRHGVEITSRIGVFPGPRPVVLAASIVDKFRV